MRSRARALLSLPAILTALAVAPDVARPQRVSGALGVSLTVLPPISTQPAELIAFRVDRNGTARLEKTAPIASWVSVIVMSSISSSVNGFVPVPQPPALLRAHRTDQLDGAVRSIDSRAALLRYEVELGRAPLRATPHDVTVRITYLIVPGT